MKAVGAQHSWGDPEAGGSGEANPKVTAAFPARRVAISLPCVSAQGMGQLRALGLRALQASIGKHKGQSPRDTRSSGRAAVMAGETHGRSW